jgi:hypothetical protein
MYSETKLPEAIKDVHEKLHSAIVDATRLGGGIGNAARSVNKALLVHFIKEEELVLPLFRTLPSASGYNGPLGRFEAYMLVERMKSELPQLRRRGGGRGRIRAIAQEFRHSCQDGGGGLLPGGHLHRRVPVQRACGAGCLRPREPCGGPRMEHGHARPWGLRKPFHRDLTDNYCR